LLQNATAEIAEISMDSGEFDVAIKTAETILESDKTHMQAIYVLGKSYMHTN
jgi:hypothetical protein